MGENFVHLRFKLTYSGSQQHPAKNQEMPAVFLRQDFSDLVW
jgi:hypothetical protein